MLTPGTGFRTDQPLWFSSLESCGSDSQNQPDARRLTYQASVKRRSPGVTPGTAYAARRSGATFLLTGKIRSRFLSKPTDQLRIATIPSGNSQSIPKSSPLFGPWFPTSRCWLKVFRNPGNQGNPVATSQRSRWAVLYSSLSPNFVKPSAQSLQWNIRLSDDQ